MVTIDTSGTGTLVVLTVEGDLDAASAGELRGAFGVAPPCAAVLLDLAHVPFLDSAGLGALLGGIRRTREAGGQLVVVCANRAVCRLLHTTGVDRIVGVHDSTAAALGALLAPEPETAA